MSMEIKIPSVGESVQEAVLGEWFKSDGEQVQIDEPLLVIETDKVTLEVAAEASGTLKDGGRRGRPWPSAQWSALIEAGKGEGGKAPRRTPSRKPQPVAPAARHPETVREVMPHRPRTSQSCLPGQTRCWHLRFALSPKKGWMPP
jgi:2-oxoglutarate dehydrogenase E2 component (dihydrolipoamide succinyltransferase)